MIETLMPLVKQFLPFAQERMGFHSPPRLFLRGDSTNADNPLGKTAFYDPGKKSITLYVTGRHPKDVMRSLSHELVHHTQNCNGKFDDVGEMGEGYAQNDDHLREMEREAYEVGNMCFRDWEDSIRSTIYFESLQKVKGVNKKMSIKDWKDGELNSLLLEKWGFKFDLDKLNERADKNTGMSDVDDDDDDDTYMGHIKKEEKEEIQETGAKDTGASKDDESKTHPGEKDYTTKKGGKTKKGEKAYEDPSKGEKLKKGSGKRGSKPGDEAYVNEGDTGASAGDESKTHPGEEDYTTKKDDELKHGGKGRGEKKGDKAYVNEDSGEEEKHHYEDNAWNDEDHIEAIEKHLRALKHDRDYDEEHEIEERRARGRNDPRVQRGTPDARARPLEEEDETSADRRQYTDSQVREALKRAIKLVKERKTHGQKK